MELTNKRHKKFADEYLTNGFNATKAYLAVYKDVKQESAEALSSKLLSNIKVEEYIKASQLVLSKKYEITKESLIKDLADIKEAQKENNATAAIKAIEVISKMLGLFEPDKIQHSGIPNITTIQLVEIKKPEDKKD